MHNVYSNPGPSQIVRDDFDCAYMLSTAKFPGIRVSQVTATWFGGTDDEDDNGETSSGVYTVGHPWILGCALPVVHVTATANPFFAGLPWGTLVRVDRLDSQYSCWLPVVDNGPANDNPAGSSIDLTLGAWAALGGVVVGGIPTRGSIPVSFTVFSGITFSAWLAYRSQYGIRR